ncbi:MAG TPA: autoinducer binding domain-containing protein [Telluria sp.]|nr:autoinducer binding domain-containing protein [Telluria sp.]
MRDADSLELIATMMAATDADDLWGRINEAAASLGFERALVGVQVHVPGMDPIQHVMSGWPEQYQLIYAERDYVMRDPTVAHCQTSTAPIIWTPEIYPRESLEVLEESRRFGLNHGLSVAVHGRSRTKSMLSLARDQRFDGDPRETERVLAGARVLATCAHMALENLLVPRLVEEEFPTKLTPRESEIMQYVANGKGSEVIGDILGLSKATVEFHVKNMLRKLGVASRLQGVARAVALGLVH